MEELWNIEELTSKDINSILNRKEGYVLVTLGGNSEFIHLNDLEKVLKESGALIQESTAVSENELTGQTASSGYAKGRAKLVLRKADLPMVEDGDIMVTYATSPDYVPSMKKCSAIVTDEGGIVCHAAIVARELGVPCIVGTGMGTKVIKDGDMIEVDADRGIVKILAS